METNNIEAIVNQYKKYIPNVFVMLTQNTYSKGEECEIKTKYGQIHKVIVFNLIDEYKGLRRYSIVRADGFNYQEFCNKKAEKLKLKAAKCEAISINYYLTVKSIGDVIPFGQPILVGHHSEKRHRRDIEKIHNNMDKSVNALKEAENAESRAEYWDKKKQIINLSTPESLEYFTNELIKAEQHHNDLKTGKAEREHSFSLAYSSKHIKELKDKIKFAKILWG